MKPTTPKDITALTAAIAEKQQACDQYRADIERAGEAAREAERLDAEIAALTQKRAEQKAMAFVSRTTADLTELDRQQDELERASRKAREDGTAAALAITMLETKIADTEAEIEDLTAQRKERYLEWIGDRRRKLLDHYMAMLDEIGGLVAKVAAMDVMRYELTPHAIRSSAFYPGDFMLGFPFKEVPIPGDCKVPLSSDRPDILRPPFDWKGTTKQFRIEVAQLQKELDGKEGQA